MDPLGKDQAPPGLPREPWIHNCVHCRDTGCVLEEQEPHPGVTGMYNKPCRFCEYGEAWARMHKAQLVDTVTKHQRRQRNRPLGWREREDA